MSHDQQHVDRPHPDVIGIDTGKGTSISRFVRPVIWGVLLYLAYVNAADIAQLLGVEGSPGDAEASVRRVVAYIAGGVAFFVIMGSWVRTRLARREGIPDNVYRP